MTQNLSQQINFERKKKKKKQEEQDKPKPFPKNAPKRYHDIYKKKYTNKDKSLGFKTFDRLRKLLD